MKPQVAWMVIAAVALANMYVGRLLAMWNSPRSMVARPSPGATAIGVLAYAAAAAFFLWNQKARVYPFTTTHAAILCGAAIGGYLSARMSYRGRGSPSDNLNAKVRVILEVCQGHQWDLSSDSSVNRLVDANQLHFHEGDYDKFVQSQSDDEHSLRAGERLPRTASGAPDYDRACAIRIVSLTNAMVGIGNTEGLVEAFSRDYDFSGFDRAGFEQLCRLGQGLQRQWGLEGLYGWS